jgi:hypothetical protein
MKKWALIIFGIVLGMAILVSYYVGKWRADTWWKAYNKALRTPTKYCFPGRGQMVCFYDETEQMQKVDDCLTDTGKKDVACPLKEIKP